MNKSTTENERRGFLSKMLVAGAGSIALFSSSAYARGGKRGGNNSSKVDLSPDQKDRLFFIYQEEKVARDVYIYWGNEYPEESTFASIQLAEQRHMDAAQRLCEKYNIDISMIDESSDDYGVFKVPYLQDLYVACTSSEITDLQGALAVGVEVEETDIGTLTETIDGKVLGEMPADVISTYETLREGSYNHLESFNARLARV